MNQTSGRNHRNPDWYSVSQKHRKTSTGFCWPLKSREKAALELSLQVVRPEPGLGLRRASAPDRSMLGQMRGQRETEAAPCTAVGLGPATPVRHSAAAEAVHIMKGHGGGRPVSQLSHALLLIFFRQSWPGHQQQTRACRALVSHLKAKSWMGVWSKDSSLVNLLEYALKHFCVFCFILCI